MLVEKKCFHLESFHFDNADRSLPIDVGYETYGTLNPRKDNVVLVCHYFTGHSHAAGKYAETDAAPGWWDAIIGPGKPLDTDRFFVICSDAISNINVHNPKVHTTGPASKNPLTGREYALDFPIFTLKDVVRSQRLLLDSLGIRRLRLVIGPSMGGLQALLWGRHFSSDVDRIVSVFATPMMRPWGIMVPNQLGIDAIRVDPKWQGGNYYGEEPPREGLLNAFKVLLASTRTDHWAETNFGRRFASTGPSPFESFDGRFLVEEEIEKSVVARMQFFDPNHYLYIAKANTLFDLCESGESLEQALGKITAPVLMIIDESDLIFPTAQARIAEKLLPNARTHLQNSQNGHLACLFETDHFADALRQFAA
jgi:homoserine O-acetyltransferase